MLKIYNTLSRSFEEFVPIKQNFVGIYSCGPTVYDYQHIGHMRRYTMDDILVQLFKADGYHVKHIMNITDVGHLVSDEDTGEDKMEKGARKYGMSVWDIAKKFEQQFFDSLSVLGIQKADEIMHATDYIQEQIDLIKVLEEKGYTYTIEDGIYFDTSKFPDYFKLSRQNPEELKKGARVEFVEGKKNAADFALWKFSYPEGVSFDEIAASPLAPRNDEGNIEKRQMEWDSPWGIGFPGWHIECSAMSMKALSAHFDLHTGGIDHIAIHHTNEIAQSECATGEKFVNYWVHHNFLVVEGEKMSKSLGNFYTVQDIIDKGYDPLALRYLYLQTHYRQEMNFTWEALDAAQKAYTKLIAEVAKWDEPYVGCAEFEQQFFDVLNDDLNTAKALSVLWELVRSDYPSSAKAKSMQLFDSILGLHVFEKAGELRKSERGFKIPEEVQSLVQEREIFRKAGDFGASDELRDKIAELGFEIQDTKEGPIVLPIH